MSEAVMVVNFLKITLTLKAVLDRFAQVKALIAENSDTVETAKKQAGEDKAKGEAESKKWMGKFNPYIVGPGQDNHNPEKYFIWGGTSDPTDLMKRKQLYDELKDLFDEYKPASGSFLKNYETGTG